MSGIWLQNLVLLFQDGDQLLFKCDLRVSRFADRNKNIFRFLFIWYTTDENSGYIFVFWLDNHLTI